MENAVQFFVGISVTKILSQLFASVFNFDDEYAVDSRDQGTRPFGGGGLGSRWFGGSSFRTGSSNVSSFTSGGWISTQRPVFTLPGDQRTYPASDPVDDERERTFYVWRMQISNAMTNPVVIFCIVIAGTLSVIWRVSRATT